MIAVPAIAHWNPEDPAFWRDSGRRIAARNLWISVAALTLSFAVWMLWSAVVVHLPAAGFRYSTNQLFWLAAAPALCGATLRLVYAFGVPLLGGRRWTALSTAVLALPCLGTGIAVQDPATPYEAMLALSLLCGLGGASFASSMAHISYLYPKRRLGFALGLNAGLGNLGLALVQFVVPMAVATGFVGAPQAAAGGAPVWLQNAGFVWLPFVALVALAAWFGMDDLAEVHSGFAEQAVIVLRPHTWRMSWLYIGTFGSFVGYTAAFPLLMHSEFPALDPAALAWAGPLTGALLRPLGGWLSDRAGGARVTFWVFAAMLGALPLAMQGLPGADGGRGPAPFVAAFALLFAAAGIGCGSTFRMIPRIFARSRVEAAAALGFCGALGAYGGFVIPKSFGTSIALTGSPDAALWLFVAFYASCLAITWWHYARRFAPMPC